MHESSLDRRHVFVFVISNEIDCIAGTLFNAEISQCVKSSLDTSESGDFSEKGDLYRRGGWKIFQI